MMHGTLTRGSTDEGGDMFFAAPEFATDGGRFVVDTGPARGGFAPNWIAIAAILGAHVALLFALVKLDVIRIEKPQVHNLTVFDLSEPAPPPIVKPEPVKPAEKAEQQVVTPAPLVQTIAPPPPIAVTNVAPPPRMIVAEAPATPPAPAGPLVLSDIDEPIFVPPLQVPMEARRKRKGANTVKVHLMIDTSGKVSEVSIVQGSGLDSLDDAIVRFVRKWRFKPVIRNGKAVEASAFTPVTVNVT